VARQNQLAVLQQEAGRLDPQQEMVSVQRLMLDEQKNTTAAVKNIKPAVGR
jgi:hypothetical protein